MSVGCREGGGDVVVRRGFLTRLERWRYRCVVPGGIIPDDRHSRRQCCLPLSSGHVMVGFLVPVQVQIHVFFYLAWERLLIYGTCLETDESESS